MNDRQSQVAATVVSGLLLVAVFLCPWRVESTGEIRWSPIYQPPLTYVRSYNDAHGIRGSSRIESDEAHIAVGLLTLELLGLGIAGGVLYVFAAGSGEADEPHSHR